ncbi:MAG: nucleotidyltransferase domain-containing protein [Acidobacteriota bacterium]|nr:MAG: nucleotidyltransferase domain-containing protein [Acidobacteriota bacterium]
MQTEIQSSLDEIESTEGVRILFACESGSRAWGFESTDSDYDVRFIYVRPRDWYLSIEEGRDVIERPIDDVLDVSGWDLKKALVLMRKSNPPLLEWLRSPIVYRKDDSATEKLRSMADKCYSPVSCFHHYLSMARGNFRDYLEREDVRLKKYFYVLRPVLACNWIEREIGPVPMEFEAMLNEVIPSGNIRSDIDDLLEKKRSSGELDRGPRIPSIHEYLESEIRRLSEKEPPPPRKDELTGELNDLFRELVLSSHRSQVGKK